MSSDSTGEIYVVVRDELSNGSSTVGGGDGNPNKGGKVSEGVRGMGTKGVGWVAVAVLVGLVVV